MRVDHRTLVGWICVLGLVVWVALTATVPALVEPQLEASLSDQQLKKASSAGLIAGAVSQLFVTTLTTLVPPAANPVLAWPAADVFVYSRAVYGWTADTWTLPATERWVGGAVVWKTYLWLTRYLVDAQQLQLCRVAPASNDVTVMHTVDAITDVSRAGGQLAVDDARDTLQWLTGGGGRTPVDSGERWVLDATEAMPQLLDWEWEAPQGLVSFQGAMWILDQRGTRFRFFRENVEQAVAWSRATALPRGLVAVPPGSAWDTDLSDALLTYDTSTGLLLYWREEDPSWTDGVDVGMDVQGLAVREDVTCFTATGDIRVADAP